MWINTGFYYYYFWVLACELYFSETTLVFISSLILGRKENNLFKMDVSSRYQPMYCSCTGEIVFWVDGVKKKNGGVKEKKKDRKLSSSQTRRNISLQEQQGLTVAYKLWSSQDRVKWCAVKVSSPQSPRACLLITFAITNMTNILLYSVFHLEQACFSSRTVTASSQNLKHWKNQSALCSSCKDHFVGISIALKRRGKA